MVLRSAFAHLLTKSRNVYRPLLAQPQPFTRLLMRTQPSSNIKPHAGFFEEPKSLLFHPDNIMKHKEENKYIKDLFLAFCLTEYGAKEFALTAKVTFIENRTYDVYGVESVTWHSQIAKTLVLNLKTL